MVRERSIARSDETDATKRECEWFSAAEYAGNYRTRGNLRGKAWAIVADLDGITDTGGVEKALARWEYIAWTTWNATPVAPRWRVVIPIEGGCEVERFSALVDRVLGPLEGMAKVDPRSRLVEQLWFFPVHKRSQARNHTVWTNAGAWARESRVISVDFTGVQLALRPETIGAGERNNSLVIRLSAPDALRAASALDLIEIALAWNARLASPLARREIISVARKKWAWMQRGEGVIRRAEAWRGRDAVLELADVGVGLMSNAIRTAKLPDSIVGDFLYPGATMISAKMKEGKSFLAMQLALSIATGSAFLAGTSHPGFAVRRKHKVVIIAGEDTAGGIASRFLGSIAAGYLPTPGAENDIRLVFNDDLDQVRTGTRGVPGLAVFEQLVARWYGEGYRVIAIDPLRVVEAALAIEDYPGTTKSMNAHARDFQTMRFYTKVAQGYDDLCILVSMHHGKNKRDHDATDPGDMIAGTTGYGAGAVTTISLLPVADALAAEEDSVTGIAAKRRELYLHGRYTREQRILIEQSPATGVWVALGVIADVSAGLKKGRYFEALLACGGTTRYVSAEEIARHVGDRTKPGSVHKVLSRARARGGAYLGWKLLIKKGVSGGYRLVSVGEDQGVREELS